MPASFAGVGESPTAEGCARAQRSSGWSRIRFGLLEFSAAATPQLFLQVKLQDLKKS